MNKSIPPKLFFCVVITVISVLPAYSQYSVESLKQLSLEELLEIEVTLVSRYPEKLTNAPSAIQVITAEQIRRSGAMNIPEALRLANNLQVSQLNSYAWIISARGFNGLFTNKLLVMIDGRTVYTPLFAGVIWSHQNVLLEDVERIEVISGPGATMWGANAVNGIINIVTKSAADTEGAYASVAGGSFMRGFGGVRYGGKIGSDISYRVYLQHQDRDSTEGNYDAFKISQTGFRLDWDQSNANTFTLQGDFFGLEEKTMPGPNHADGQNILARWRHVASEKSGFSLQLYFDRTWRNDKPSVVADELLTYDIDFHHYFTPLRSHRIVWGAGYRLMKDHVINRLPTITGYFPERRDMDLFSVFVQDEITLVEDKLQLVAGTKLQHNEFTDFEVQPSARAAWHVNEKNTLWSAVSRAVRTPSRIDADLYFLPFFPGGPNVAGGPNFESEVVVAYELGYRAQPVDNLSFSISAFHNEYDKLYSVEPESTGSVTFTIQNGGEGESRGVEFEGTFQPLTWWRLKGGYTYFSKDLRSRPGHAADYASLGNEPMHQVLLFSMMNLPANFQLDVTGRFVDELKNPEQPDYFAFDGRLSWLFKSFEFAVAGRNIFDNSHREWLLGSIPRNFYVSATWRMQ